MKLVRDIELPASKSESNRALMIAAYGGFAPDFQNLSDANDTAVLRHALEIAGNRYVQRSVHVIPSEERASVSLDSNQPQHCIDIADCGTAARFLTTFLACHEGQWLLTGTERMKQRPIKPLVDALLGLGAEIQYVEKEGFLPLRIIGKPLQGGKVQIDASQSSQFASSLLLAAPMFPQGLELEVLGDLNSLPYLDMTLSMMCHFSAQVERKGHRIVVLPKPYQPARFMIAPDWSAASYWYEMAALSEDCVIRLSGLRRAVLQGDAVIAEWMKALGVSTFEEGDALVLQKTAFERKPLSFDFSNTPDLFPTMAATCAGLQLEAHFTGIANLHLKESDRVEAMKTELAKMGVEMLYISENELVINPTSKLPHFEESNPLSFEAHGDHRVVMALAPLALKVGNVVFDHPEVVEKSYISFWEDASFLRICE